ncbi:hydantoinase B/oxoprolinase family protein [Sphingomonas colocasiae]|uniref:Hydantoinase B/oxoprolinase family protein n=1 Tax=Sphingomonas colocasiae TaxID=1848973 RepID=A0ABS7PWC7_9SPHN|nr:hydantoinase B/oxoprolinase family protein [Sphingomonas colocasiae]MBY8825513.1 hydantoinase B/oxoprolinase family protein [Sphingomonas colocasiae]
MIASDPITLEIVKNALSSLADEMALVILRSAYSPIVRDSMDYSTAICDRNGEIVAQGLTNPIHLGAFPDVMRILVEQHLDGMKPGDAFLVNDPYGGGGMHLPDVFLIKPLFIDGALEGFAGTLVHHSDIGGLAPGSMGLQATEIFQEGLRIPIVKLFDAGTINGTTIAFLKANSRTPIELMGDLSAQIASVDACERGYVQLVRKYGSASFRGFLVELHNYAERLMRQQIAAMPDGRYDYVDYVDGLGDDPRPIRFEVCITIAGDSVNVDWTGTSPQVQGAINGPMPTTTSMTYVALRAAIHADIPNFAGYMRPVRVSAPLGTIVNPTAPAACAARGVIAYRMLDTLFGALNKIPGSRIPALGEGGPSVVSFSGWDEGKAWIITDGILGSWGGRSGKDGVDGISSPGTNLSNQPIELIEARMPLRVLSYAFAQDSGGAGKYRGGLAMVRSYEMLADEGLVQLRSDRRDHLPVASSGGLPGSPSYTWLEDGGAARLLPVMPMGPIAISAGARLVHLAAGGAGLGNPFDRDPQAVLGDVLDERISPDMARDAYGVALDTAGRSVDAAATAVLRAAATTAEQLTAQQQAIFARTNNAARLLG